jgi:hypothetical protein
LCISGHDWAIIELDQPVEFNEHIAPICLPNKDIEIEPNLMAVSWGRPKCESPFNRSFYFMFIVYLTSDPLIREIPLKYDSTCTPSSGDIMPTKVDDYLCALSVEPFNRHTKRICHVSVFDFRLYQ